MPIVQPARDLTYRKLQTTIADIDTALADILLVPRLPQTARVAIRRIREDMTTPVLRRAARALLLLLLLTGQVIILV